MEHNIVRVLYVCKQCNPVFNNKFVLYNFKVDNNIYYESFLALLLLFKV